jgi:hypothetical protein
MPKEVQVQEETTKIDEDNNPGLDLTKMLDTLVPPKTVTVADVFGNEYETNAVCSARSQIRILRKFEELQTLPAIAEQLGDNIAIGDAASIAALIVKVASDPQVLGGIASAFEIGHPKTYTLAVKAAKKQGLKEIEDAADLFPIEELVAAVLPLFMSLLRKSATAINALTGATTPIA